MNWSWRVTIFDRYHPQVREFKTGGGFPLAHTWAINACTAWTTRVEILRLEDAREPERITVVDEPTGNMPWCARAFYYDEPTLRVKEFEDLENAHNWVIHRFERRPYYFEMFRVLPLEAVPKPYVSGNVWGMGDKYYEKQVQL